MVSFIISLNNDMRILDKNTKFAYLGKPGESFSKGFARRLSMVLEVVDIKKDKKILDLGFGMGVWIREFVKYTLPGNVFGTEYDREIFDSVHKQLIEELGIPIENLVLCSGENLLFEDELFDIVFHNEVLEHVWDDAKMLNECFRVLKKGGYLIFFTPNSGWPFETHGMFIGDKYIWGNIPLLPWLPKFLYKKLITHVRNYSSSEIKSLIKNSLLNYDYELVLHRRIFPGFDRLEKKNKYLGRLAKKFFYFLEKTPLEYFGLSHYVVIKKL